MKLHRATRELVSPTVSADVDLGPATLEVSIGTGPFNAWPWVNPAA